ncbi:MAG: class I SAM-dependent methyltransferase [Armatimonadota bacterium]|nr:MAG: class I SAM-dependent methyltransferase [Armatimonadota bacterium]
MPSNHYFTERPTSRGKRQTLTVTLRGRKLRLITESGVFSRARVDPGTRLLINHMEVGEEERFLDLGCGYGVVGIIAALLAPKGKVTLVDINERAVALARENLALNNIQNAEALQGDGFAPVAGRTFDVIALNPPIRSGLRVVHHLIEESSNHLSPQGCFYLVGRTRQGVIRLAQKMSQTFEHVQEIAKGGGYRVYRSRREASPP